MATPDEIAMEIGGLVNAAEQQFPALSQFLALPGIAPVILKAAQEQWSPGRLQAEIWNTDYWKNTTAEQRSWDLLAATDPAEAQRRWNVGVQHAWDVLD